MTRNISCKCDYNIVIVLFPRVCSVVSTRPAIMAADIALTCTLLESLNQITNGIKCRKLGGKKQSTSSHVAMCTASILLFIRDPDVELSFKTGLTLFLFST